MQTILSPQQISERGEAIYAASLQDQLEKTQIGKCLILDVESGDYEFDTDDMVAQERIQARRPQGVFYGIRIGEPTMYFSCNQRRSGRMQ